MINGLMKRFFPLFLAVAMLMVPACNPSDEDETQDDPTVASGEIAYIEFLRYDEGEAAGLFGKHSKHLIETETEEENDGVVTYTYKKENGRIVEVRRADGEAVGGPIGGVFKIYWK